MFLHRRLVLAIVALGLATIATGCGISETTGPATPAKSEVRSDALSEAEFVAQADRICALTGARFVAELPDPVDGNKPVGIGPFMREWVAEFRTLVPPAKAAKHWNKGLSLLVEASHKLDDAEAGDPDAQSEALWGLEARAMEHFDAMHVPFNVCFL